jgi:lipopolysaccharide/colanic/teichoic acid biosynthesis glycosyltransferase
VSRTRAAIQVSYFATIVLAVLGLGKFHAKAVGSYDLSAARTFPWFIVFAVALCLSGYIVGVPDRVRTLERALLLSTVSVTVCVFSLAVVQAVSATPLLPRLVLATAPLFVISLSVLFSALSLWVGRRQQRVSRAVVVADRDDLARLALDVDGMDQPLVSVAAVALSADMAGSEMTTPLIDLVAEHDASLVVLARSAQDNERIVAQAARLHASGVRVRTLSRFYEEHLAKLPLGELERISLMFDISEVHPGIYPRLKRALDVGIGAIGTLSLLVVVPFVALVNLFGNRGPLLYRQVRVGRNGELFTIIKFRSMRPDSGHSNWTQHGDVRVTRVGNVLRRSHIDELPQMINILRGDLSIVGPRPEQPHYVEELSGKLPFYDLRHLVRPGLTGWAQVRYGYGGSEDDALEKLQYEFFYLRHQSLRLDLLIMVQTVRKVFASGNR